MGRKRKHDEGLETFNRDVVRSGLTYAEVQRMETSSGIGQIRAPKTERPDGEPVYMTVAARKMLKSMEER